MKRNLFVTFIAIAIATSAVALSRSSIAQKSPNQDKGTASSPSGLKPVPGELTTGTAQPFLQDLNAQAASSQPQDQTVPDHIVYDQMFRHIKELKKKAVEDERQGKDGGHFRTLYKRLAKLEEHQAQTLGQVADDVERQVEKLDKKALNIIRKLRERHPGGKLAQGRTAAGSSRRTTPPVRRAPRRDRAGS